LAFALFVTVKPSQSRLGLWPARQHAHLALRREAVDLLRVEVELQRVQELVRVLDLLLPLEQLPQPGERAVVLVDAGAALLVLPVRGNALLGHAVHVDRADLDLERVALVADHRGVERLVAVRARHRDEVLDPARYGPPGVVQHAERRVAVGDALDQHAQRDEVVDLLEVDPLAAQLLVDRVQALDPPLDARLDAGRVQLLGDGRADPVDERRRGLRALLDARRERLVARGVEVLEREVLELVLDLRHAEPAGDRGVDVERLAGDALAPLFRQVLQRAHVVQAVGELHQDHPDVVDHRQQHLAVRLGLPLLGGRVRDLRDLGDTLDDVQHVRAEVVLQPFRGGERVLEHVVEQPDRDADRVHPHLGEDRGHLERVHEVGFARGPQLALVLDRREDVCLAEDLQVGLGVVPLDGLLDVLEPNHA
jgi:hypothetical protein